MSFTISHRDTPRTVRLKLLYLVPLLVVALPCVLVSHGVVGFVEVVRGMPREYREIRRRMREVTT